MLQDQVTVFEPDAGDITVVTGCFSAEIGRSLDSDAIFDFSISPASTAEEFADHIILGRDFFFNPSLIIPAGFNGSFFTCIDILIFGDDEPENVEIAGFEIIPRSQCNLVIFPPGSNSTILSIIIFENNCELISEQNE